jgi:hypothetical protein
MLTLVLYYIHLIGYCFKSAEDIQPFAEDRATGRTVQWAAKQGMYRYSGANKSIVAGPD